jgi:hypothetical protein
MVEQIGDNDDLYRRLNPRTHFRNGRVTRGAFYAAGDKPDPEVSVDLARLINHQPEQTARGDLSRSWHVGALKAGVPIGLGLTVEHAPKDDNYAHTYIKGLDPEEGITRVNQLADAVEVVYWNPDVDQ